MVSASTDDTAGWNEVVSQGFPNTSLYRSTEGSATPHSSSYGYAISNHAYGRIQSDTISVTPNTEYDLYAQLRGELDSDNTTGRWYIQANYYDENGNYLGYQNAEHGSALTNTWERKGGRITTPANAAQMRTNLTTELVDGWVAFDEVALTEVIELPSSIVINYDYDPLYRLTDADHSPSTGSGQVSTYYDYTYTL